MFIMLYFVGVCYIVCFEVTYNEGVVKNLILNSFSYKLVPSAFYLDIYSKIRKRGNRPWDRG